MLVIGYYCSYIFPFLLQLFHFQLFFWCIPCTWAQTLLKRLQNLIKCKHTELLPCPIVVDSRIWSLEYIIFLFSSCPRRWCKMSVCLSSPSKMEARVCVFNKWLRGSMIMETTYYAGSYRDAPKRQKVVTQRKCTNLLETIPFMIMARQSRDNVMQFCVPIPCNHT